MSKTKQRKQSLYQQGYVDGKHIYGSTRWATHSQLSEYMKGFNQGKKEAKTKLLLQGEY